MDCRSFHKKKSTKRTSLAEREFQVQLGNLGSLKAVNTCTKILHVKRTKLDCNVLHYCVNITLKERCSVNVSGVEAESLDLSYSLFHSFFSELFIIPYSVLLDIHYSVVYSFTETV